MSRRIRLANNRGWAIIDDEDYERVIRHSWCVTTHTNTKYAQANIKTENGWRRISMHRFIMNAQKGHRVDHKDRNGLNNRRSNLRFYSGGQNGANAPSRFSRGGKRTSSGYKGVYIDKYRTGWVAQVGYNDGRIYLGTFDTEEDAARHYDAAAFELYGDFALLNFPGEQLLKLHAGWRDIKQRRVERKKAGKYKGVRPHSTGRWWAECSAAPKKYLGLFENDTEAATAHDLAACWFIGERAVLNYPHDRNRYIELTPDNLKDMTTSTLRSTVRDAVNRLRCK